MARPLKPIDEDSITWKRYQDYPNYLVSDIGEIYSIPTQKILKKGITRRGYQEVKMSKHGLAVTKLVHRVVCDVFLGKNTLTVNHKDGNKTNNNLKNLELLSMEDNRRHAVELGLFTSGTKRPNSKLKLEDIFFIMETKGKITSENLAKKYLVDQSTIVRIRNKQRYKGEIKIWEEIKNQLTGK